MPPLGGSEQRVDLGVLRLPRHRESRRSRAPRCRRVRRRQLIDLFAQVGKLLHRLLRRVGIAPEALIPRAKVEFGYRALFAFVVKDAP
jgi:hypothetical protein